MEKQTLLLLIFEQLLKFYIDTESVDDIGFENFFDDNSSIIGTGKHEFFRNLHEFQESYKFDVKQRGKIRLKIRDLQQEEAERSRPEAELSHLPALR